MEQLEFIILFFLGLTVGCFLNGGIDYFILKKKPVQLFEYKKYPFVILCNGGLWLAAGIVFGFAPFMVLSCLFLSVLLLLSVIDWKTYEIPDQINYFIGGLGILNLILHRTEWLAYGMGFFSVGLFLYILYQITKGAAIGGGDVKLMAFSGLILGWQQILLAFFIGCIFGSVIHLIRMKVSNQGPMLAMGPYLAIGMAISLLFGDRMISWYLAQCLG